MTRLQVLVAAALALGTGVGCSPAEERDDHSTPPGEGVTNGPAAQGAGGGGTGGAGGADPAGSGGGDAVPPCDEWSGPFGTETDDTVDPTLEWEGFGGPSADVVQVNLGDYAVCGGDLETKAIVIYIDALWCSICRDVAGDLAEKYDSEWRHLGIEVITVVVEDSDGNPATLDAAWQWRDTFGLEAMPVVADPDYVLANPFPKTLPQALLIDPRTMRVVDRPIGKVDLDPLLASLLAASEE